MTRGIQVAAAVLAALLPLQPLAATGPQGTTENAEGEARSDLFIVIYRPGPSWQAGRPMSEQGLLPHGRYMRSLFDQGRLQGGGPFVGSDGGMMIVRASGMDEIHAILAADPAVIGGIFVAQVEHWWPRFRAPQPLPAPVSSAPR